MPDLLIEILSEEIPARMQTRAAEDLNRLVTEGLVEAGLTYAHAIACVTPRRLVLAVEELLAESPAVREERKGPRIDAPEKALEGFLRSTGLIKDQLEARDEKKGKVWYALIERPGRPAAEIVAEILEQAIRDFPWPKSMRWGRSSLRWVRPLQSILCILTDENGAATVPLEIDGIKAGDQTEGHRFMAPSRFSVSSFEDYEAKLKRAKVILRTDERADHIWTDASNLAFAQGLEVVEDKGLLAEVAGLVEWPVVLIGEIGAEYLDLPSEVLRTSMREHQKFFSVRNPETGRIEKFLTVANIEAPDQGAAILAGNHKVLAARLSDAKFFWENDLRMIGSVGMTGMAKPLENVTFHAKLGTQADRVERIAALASGIAPLVGAKPDLAEGKPQESQRPTLPLKWSTNSPNCRGPWANTMPAPPDMTTECRRHAKSIIRHSGLPTTFRRALFQRLWHWPTRSTRLQASGQLTRKPTGSKDPYSLRRAALGIIRILLANEFRLELSTWLASASSKHVTDAEQTSGTETDSLIAFFHDRLKVHLRDEGIRHDIIDACLSLSGGGNGDDDLVLLVKRAKALSAFLGTEDGENLLQGFKRANNILTQAEEKDGVEYSFGADAKFAEDETERALFAALDAVEPKIEPAMKNEDFGLVMQAMAELRAL